MPAPCRSWIQLTIAALQGTWTWKSADAPEDLTSQGLQSSTQAGGWSDQAEWGPVDAKIVGLNDVGGEFGEIVRRK
jgi:hypothetical protein